MRSRAWKDWISRAGPALVLTALVSAGCSGTVNSLSFAPPPTTVALPPPPSTLPPGLAGLTETGVPGITTTVAPQIGPGAASLTGNVTGPNGPAGGATVQIDRFNGTSFASARTTTAADGTWSFRNILGGSYRVRAWQPPSLDMPAPQTLFLAAGQPASVTLQLTAYAGPQVQAAISPSPPIIDEPVNMVLQVTNPTVDANGILSAAPVTNTSITLVNGPGWQVQYGNPLTTDFNGHVQFQIQCTQLGPDALGVQIGGNQPISLELPPCSTPPPTTTTSTTNPFFSTTTCPPPQGNGNGNGNGNGRTTTTTVAGTGSC